MSDIASRHPRSRSGPLQGLQATPKLGPYRALRGFGRIFGKQEVEPRAPATTRDCTRPITRGKTRNERYVCTSRGLLATNLRLLPRRLQLPVALRVDLLLPPSQHVLRRDVAGGAVQPDVVVVVNVALHQTPRIIERQRRPWPDALPSERLATVRSSRSIAG